MQANELTPSNINGAIGYLKVATNSVCYIISVCESHSIRITIRTVSSKVFKISRLYEKFNFALMISNSFISSKLFLTKRALKLFTFMNL